MRRILFILAVAVLGLSSCVENSSKYKALKAQLDSLQVNFGLQAGELDEAFAILNEVEGGLKSIRESENIITVQSQSEDGLNIPEDSKVRIKKDIEAVQKAIERYQNQIKALQNDKRIQSAQFKKRLNALSAELKEKSTLIESLSKQLDEKDSQLAIKTEQIASLDFVVSNLKNEVSALSEESSVLKDKVATQEKELYTSYYIIASKSDLINAGVLTKGGLFKSAKISYQAEKSAFIAIDHREINIINTNAEKAKILSIHPQGSYTFESVSGEMILTITDSDAFWEHTKYLVIQTS